MNVTVNLSDSGIVIDYVYIMSPSTPHLNDVEIITIEFILACPKTMDLTTISVIFS